MRQKKNWRNWRFPRLLRRLQLDRGRLVEEKTLSACVSLKVKGLIHDFSNSKPNDFNDRVRKWDALIITNNFRKIWFQIKSSDSGVRQHLERYGNKIPVIKIEPHLTEEEIEMALIEKFLN